MKTQSQLASPMTLRAGVDGCHGGWLAIIAAGKAPTRATVYPSFTALMRDLGPRVRIGIDIPIGLLERGARLCEIEARQRLGRPRMSSVFPAPPIGCLKATTYQEACRISLRIDNKSMSKQAYGILPKIREVDAFLAGHPRSRRRIVEVHPELSFAAWLGVRGLQHRKRSQEGKAERRAPIEKCWPGMIDQFRNTLRGSDYVLDDLHDAFAALWSLERLLQGNGEFLGHKSGSATTRGHTGILI